MDDLHRQDYLRALGIDPWVLRSAAEGGESESAAMLNTSRLHIGPGNGNTLILCGGADEAATALAADLARCLDSEPVWGWPDDNDNALDLQQAVEQRLFTRVLVLHGDPTGVNPDAGREVIASARVLRSRSMPELANDGRAKQELWAELCGRNWCADRARKPGSVES